MDDGKIIDLEQEAAARVRALLVGAPGTSLKELEGLTDTAGMEKARAVTLTRLEPSPAYGMGSGKAKELAALAEEISADVIIFDFELEPRKQRNWEKLAKRPVFDRQEVILRIFAQRARTKEAVLQVELARLEYSLPRLAHSYGDMARQRGGSYGAKGSGETQLELDMRGVREKIRAVKKELAQVVSERETQRKRREKIPVPSCALVGYTNAGKSSLLNALTGADVFVEDKLFATLDPTTRKLRLKTGSAGAGGNILLTDTVGFISNLPHSLVNAFKSTLEEAERADLILLLLDANDENVLAQFKTVCGVLEEIGAADIPRVIVLNKIDKLGADSPVLAGLAREFPGAEHISVKTRAGFEALSARICTELMGRERRYVIPAAETALLADVRRTGIITEESWLDDGVHLKVQVGALRSNPRLLALLKPYSTDYYIEENEPPAGAGFTKRFGADW